MFARFTRPRSLAGSSPSRDSVAITSPPATSKAGHSAPPKLELDLDFGRVNQLLAERLPNNEADSALPAPQITITITSPSTIAPETPRSLVSEHREPGPTLEAASERVPPQPAPVPDPVTSTEPAVAAPNGNGGSRSAPPARHEVFVIPWRTSHSYDLANPAHQTGGATPPSTPPPTTARHRRPGLLNGWSSLDKTPRPGRDSVDSVRSDAVLRRPPPAGKSKVRHEARVLFAVLTGVLPGVEVASQETIDARRGSFAEGPDAGGNRVAKGGRGKGKGKASECQVIPHVSSKSLKKLKEGLMKPSEARQIVLAAKSLEVPSGEVGLAGDPLHHPTTKAYHVNPVATAEDTGPSPAARASAFSVPSAGSIVGVAGDLTGAFDLIGDASGALLRTGHVLLSPPRDRITVVTYWWGYELALPPPVLRDLDHAHLVSTYLLHFLQGFVLAGGAPELAPFLRAIAAYFDLEWDAIRSQDKGKGVVVAATWLIPVALVPRPWDFGDARD